MKESEFIIWVNDNDEEIGYGEKMETHVRGILHRAFSLFIYNEYDNTLLIHRRAIGKYHSGGLWTNSCCSHPRYGEELIHAVERRMQEELGFYIPALHLNIKPYNIQELGFFQYYQKYNTCAENEIDHVFSIIINEEHPEIKYNQNEIESIKWITIEHLEEWYNDSPDDFTAWFYKAYLIFKHHFNDKLSHI